MLLIFNAPISAGSFNASSFEATTLVGDGTPVAIVAVTGQSSQTADPGTVVLQLEAAVEPSAGVRIQFSEDAHVGEAPASSGGALPDGAAVVARYVELSDAAPQCAAAVITASLPNVVALTFMSAFTASSSVNASTYSDEAVLVSGDRPWGVGTACLAPDSALGSVGFCIDDGNGDNVFPAKGALLKGMGPRPAAAWRDGTGDCEQRKAVALCATASEPACAGWNFASGAAPATPSSAAPASLQFEPSAAGSPTSVWRIFESATFVVPASRLTFRVAGDIESLAVQCDVDTKDQTYTHTFDGQCFDSTQQLKLDSDELLGDLAEPGEVIVGCDRIRILAWTTLAGAGILLEELAFGRGLCGGNRYKNADGFCEDCQACAVSPVVGLFRADCGKSSPGECEVCPPNTKATDGFTCVVCNEGGELCTDGLGRPCPAGHWCEGGGHVEACDSGQYCKAGSSASQACPAGSVCATSAVKAECPVSPVSGLGLGDFCPESSTEIEPCPAGFVCATPATKEECNQGSFCPKSSWEVKPCPAGFFCLMPTVKVECSLGDFCPESSTEVKPCPAGFTCASPAKKQECSGGDYCPESSTEVKPCPLGSVCVTPAETQKCSAGDYCPESSTEVKPCPLGYVCATPSQKKKCDPGVYCGKNSVETVPCEVGALVRWLN